MTADQTRLNQIRAANGGDQSSDIGFLLGLMARAFAEVRALKERLPDAAPKKNFTTEAAMKCGEERFQMFLLGHPKLGAAALAKAVDDETPREAAQRRLRALTGVTSMKEFNEGANAAKEWGYLRNDFIGWDKNGTYRDQVSRIGGRR